MHWHLPNHVQSKKERDNAYFCTLTCCKPIEDRQLIQSRNPRATQHVSHMPCNTVPNMHTSKKQTFRVCKQLLNDKTVFSAALTLPLGILQLPAVDLDCTPLWKRELILGWWGSWPTVFTFRNAPGRSWRYTSQERKAKKKGIRMARFPTR